MQTIGARREKLEASVVTTLLCCSKEASVVTTLLCCSKEASVVTTLLCSSTYHTRISSLIEFWKALACLLGSYVATLHKTPHRTNKVGHFHLEKLLKYTDAKQNYCVVTTNIPHMMGLPDHVPSLWQTLSMKVVFVIYLEFSSQTKHALEPGVVPV